MIPENVAAAANNCEINAVVEWLAAHPQSVNDVDSGGESLLVLCVNESYDGIETNQDDQLELVRYLLSQGADPNLSSGSDDETPLYASCGSGRAHPFPHAQLLVACLLRAGADPNLKVAENAPLFSALDCFLGADEGSWILPVVAHLLRYGASLDNCEGNRSAEEVMQRRSGVGPSWSRETWNFKLLRF